MADWAEEKAKEVMCCGSVLCTKAYAKALREAEARGVERATKIADEWRPYNGPVGAFIRDQWQSGTDSQGRKDGK